MKKFIKENWFKLAILFFLFGILFLYYINNKENKKTLSETQNKEKIEQNNIDLSKEESLNNVTKKEVPIVKVITTSSNKKDTEQEKNIGNKNIIKESDDLLAKNFVKEIGTIIEEIFLGESYNEKGMGLANDNPDEAIVYYSKTWNFFTKMKEDIAYLQKFKALDDYETVVNNITCVSDNFILVSKYNGMVIVYRREKDYKLANYYLVQGNDSDKKAFECLNTLISFIK